MTAEPETERTKAPESARTSFLTSFDTTLKVVATLLALIIPAVAAFFGFSYAVSDLKRETESKTCALTIKAGIARAVIDYLDLVAKGETLPEPASTDTEEEAKKKQEARQKLDQEKQRALNRRKFYEEAEKNIWRGGCSEIEAKAQQL